MGKIFYNKLIRDRIPEIIAASGKSCEIETIPEEAFERALLEKLVEEAREAQQADPAHLKTELADLQEVLDALMALRGIPRQAVNAEKHRRRKARGAFTQRLRLLWTE